MKEYLEYLRTVKKRNQKTIKQYHGILREFRAFEPVTPHSWNRYLDLIAGNKPKTQRNKLTVVKGYLNYKADNGRLTVDRRFWLDAEAPKEQHLPKALEMEEIQKIIEATDNEYYRSVFSLLANSGMRISELLNLKPEDVTINGVAKIRITGKGNKERVINIPREVMENAINAGLFDRKITARAVEKALKKYAAKAGIKKHVTPHILRHSFGVALAKRNMPINQIQAILGHANLSTTSIYLAIAGNNIEIPQLV